MDAIIKSVINGCFVMFVFAMGFGAGLSYTRWCAAQEQAAKWVVDAKTGETEFVWCGNIGK